jgi:uncharacterized membrane protein
MGPSADRPPEPSRNNPQVSLSHQRVEYSGHIPPPAVLKEFDQIVPGAANRIIVMAEKQQEHRHDLERVAVRSGSRDSIAGVGAATLISVGFLSLAGYAIKLGYTGTGVILGAIDIVALASAFIYGTNSQRQEREGRSKQEK